MDIRIDVYHHGLADVGEHREVLAKLDEILVRLQQERHLMAQIRQDVADIITKFNVETTAISERLDRLIAASSTLTADEKAAFQAISDHLDVMGTDPTNPVPPLPPA